MKRCYFTFSVPANTTPTAELANPPPADLAASLTTKASLALERHTRLLQETRRRTTGVRIHTTRTTKKVENTEAKHVYTQAMYYHRHRTNSQNSASYSLRHHARALEPLEPRSGNRSHTPATASAPRRNRGPPPLSNLTSPRPPAPPHHVTFLRFPPSPVYPAKPTAKSHREPKAKIS